MRRRCGEILARTIYVARIALWPSQRKHALRWLRSSAPDYPLRANMPWITFDALDYLSEHLSTGLRAFEYGSGGSTLFLRRLASLCVSIEHDPTWYARLRSVLRPGDAVDYRLVPPGPPDEKLTGDPADPDAYLSTDLNNLRRSFRAYAEQIDGFPDEFFDLVLVDGRARPACIRHGAPKVRPGGLLVLDNADRPYYTARTASDLREFTRLRFAGVGAVVLAPWTTDVYRKHGPRDGRA